MRVVKQEHHDEIQGDIFRYRQNPYHRLLKNIADSESRSRALDPSNLPFPVYTQLMHHIRKIRELLLIFALP
jgi:hypothetical protein